MNWYVYIKYSTQARRSNVAPQVRVRSTFAGYILPQEHLFILNRKYESSFAKKSSFKSATNFLKTKITIFILHVVWNNDLNHSLLDIWLSSSSFNWRQWIIHRLMNTCCMINFRNNELAEVTVSNNSFILYNLGKHYFSLECRACTRSNIPYETHHQLLENTFAVGTLHVQENKVKDSSTYFA